MLNLQIVARAVDPVLSRSSVRKPLKEIIQAVAEMDKFAPDSASFTQTTDKKEIAKFVKILVDSITQLEKNEKIAPIKKLGLNIEKRIASTILNLSSRMSKVMILKDKEGKFLCGFSYEFNSQTRQLLVNQMALAPSKQNTKEGLEALVRLGKEVKRIANIKGAKQITCDVDTSNKSLVRLYEKMGFMNVASKTKRVCEFIADTEDFGKGFI